MSEGPVLKAGMTAAQLIDAIVAYYGVDPAARRSMNEGKTSCRYNGADGCHCAFYWMVKDPTILNAMDFVGSGNTAKNIITDHGFQCLKEEVRHLPEANPAYNTDAQQFTYRLQFWQEIQNLHDFSQNWGVTGLTEAGESFVRRIKRQYGKARAA